MDGQTRQKKLNRRAFLKTAGGAGAALLLATLAEQSMAARSRELDRQLIKRLNLKIGVVLPESSRSPLLQRDLLDGMRLYFKQVDAGNLELLPRNYGTSPSRALDEARLLVARDRAHLLVGVACRNYLTGLEPLLQERGVPLVACDIGENIISERQGSPYVYRSSLNLWQSNYALGSWAAGALGKTAVIASSIYESGYDSLYAFQRAFEQAGGTILETHITHVPNGDGRLSALPEAIAAVGPDLVFASYSGQEAVDFVRAYAGSRLDKTPLVGSGFLTDESLLAEHGDAALGIRTVLPWAGDLATEQQNMFASEFRAATGRQPGVFAAQGYDTGALIIRSLVATGGSASNIDAFRQSFATAMLTGPRGQVSVDAQTLELNAPLYLREVRRSEGALRNALVETLDHGGVVSQQASDVRPQIHTGWLQGYLCS